MPDPRVEPPLDAPRFSPGTTPPPPTRPASPPHRPIGLAAALLPLATMLLLVVASAIWLGMKAEFVVIAMLAAAAVAGLVAVRHGGSWADIQRAAGTQVAGVFPALLILLAIGMLIALWTASGTIPFLVYWGIRMVRPEFLVLTAFLATAVMSLFTGTSWGSAGTIGVAMMGTAAALGAPLPMVAGAVVSGAYFGDKMSPLSDSTIIAAVAAEVDLYAHIRHMLYTAGPSFLLALILYATVGHLAGTPNGGMPESGRVMLTDIAATYRLGWYAMLPPLVVVACLVGRVPAAVAIALSSLAAAVIAVVVQHVSIQDTLTATVTGFRLPMLALGSVREAALSATFTQLVERGGLYSMATTLVMVFAAFLLAAALEVSGALNLLITRLLASVRSTFALIAATMASGATVIALTSHNGVTMLVVGGLFRQAYRERALAPQNLSRSLEDSVTITEPLMPWTVSAVFMATTLGVPTLAYAPWAIFCLGGPVFSLLIAATWRRTGFGIRPLAPGR